MMSFYGICPKGHFIERLRIGDAEVPCTLCGGEYLVEDEQHI